MNVYTHLRKALKTLGFFIFTICFISTIQWLLIQFIATYCSPFTVWGPLINLFTIGSPLCYAANQIQIRFMDHYMIIWTGVITTFTGWIFKLFNE